jgi:hypothetical protein
MSDLHAIDFSLVPIAQAALPALDRPESADAYPTTIKAEHVPVKKSIGDWMLFRGISTVRRRLFGDDLQQAIAPEIKTARLAEPARAAFAEMIDSTVKEKFPALPTKFSALLAGSYAAKFRTTILESLRQQRDTFAADLAAAKAPHQAITDILAAMKALDDQSSKSVGEIILMAQQETGAPLVEGEQTPAAPLQEFTAA